MTTFDAAQRASDCIIFEVEWLPEDASSFTDYIQTMVVAYSFDDAVKAITMNINDVRSVRRVGLAILKSGGRLF